jgi:hypothetical protein
MSSSFDRQFQQRLELIFKKAEFDRMQEDRRQRALEEKKKQQNASAQCDKKDNTPKPRTRFKLF